MERTREKVSRRFPLNIFTRKTPALSRETREGLYRGYAISGGTAGEVFIALRHFPPPPPRLIERRQRRLIFCRNKEKPQQQRFHVYL